VVDAGLTRGNYQHGSTVAGFQRFVWKPCRCNVIAPVAANVLRRVRKFPTKRIVPNPLASARVNADGIGPGCSPTRTIGSINAMHSKRGRSATLITGATTARKMDVSREDVIDTLRLAP